MLSKNTESSRARPVSKKIKDVLQDMACPIHIGKNKNSKDITNRNIYIGTEIEFVWFDEIVEEEKLITGVVLETIYELSTFKVDSFEKIYMVEIDMITKILNNTKFKYNLNKLNNIDFL
jgi:hypothetical protein